MTWGMGKWGNPQKVFNAIRVDRRMKYKDEARLQWI